MRIITIGREFGSGGRELGKRLADALGIPCYDKEIITEVAKIKGIDDSSIEQITEQDINSVYSITIGRTMCYYTQVDNDVISAQQKVIKKLASEGDCVIVGRQADVILSDMDPLNIFVYADRDSRLARCLARDTEGEGERAILKKMKTVDRQRAANRRLVTSKEWGKPESYHLCVNTSGIDIKTLIPALADYARAWFEK